MNVTFWGTRGSLPTPGPTTNKYGGNTPCVEMTTNGGTLLIFDAGTGIRGLGDSLLSRKTNSIHGHLFFTHTHWDHIQGFPFFLPLYSKENHFMVYAPRTFSKRR